MNTDTLEVVLDGAIEREQVSVSAPTSTYVSQLRREGYRYVKLLGLAQLHTKGFRGDDISDFFVPIEHDVELLLEHSTLAWRNGWPAVVPTGCTPISPTAASRSMRRSLDGRFTFALASSGILLSKSLSRTLQLSIFTHRR